MDNASMDNAVILVDKPAGISSFGVVARVRGYLRARYGRKIKVGHTGTLDPFATGLLILLTGKMTKKSDEFLKKDKVYEAVMRLGYTSTTGDPEGEMQPYSIEEHPTRAASPRPVATGEARSSSPCQAPEALRLDTLRPVVQSFVGTIFQKVPAFSAVKINGERAYRLARKGVDFETPTREVTVYSIEILSYEYPYLMIRCHVSSGTYIRTLAEDIGAALGTGAYLTSLRRLSIADYSVDDAHKLDEFVK